MITPLEYRIAGALLLFAALLIIVILAIRRWLLPPDDAIAQGGEADEIILLRQPALTEDEGEQLADQFIAELRGWPHADTAAMPAGHRAGPYCEACGIYPPGTAADGWPVSDLLAPDDVYWPDQWERFAWHSQRLAAEEAQHRAECGLAA